MVDLIIIIVGFIVAFEFESSHDKIVSSFKQTTAEGRKWHLFDFFYLGVISLIIAYLYKGITVESGLILIIIAGLRMTFFPIRFNRKRGSDWDYLGAEGYDKFVRKVFFGRNKLYFAFAGLSTLASILYSFYLVTFK